MKILIATDSYKNSLTAKEVCQTIKSGFSSVIPNAKFALCPMADGGRGTMDTIVENLSGKIIIKKVTNAFGKQVSAKIGVVPNKKLGIVEMAQAAGIEGVSNKKLNPMLTTTFGVGQLIKACLDLQLKTILIGVGGSCTNDAGAGLLQSLGVKLLDKEGRSLKPGGSSLINLSKIDITHMDPRLNKINLIILTDVNNTLIGVNGASRVFGPQKGATKTMIKPLDESLEHFADVVQQQLRRNIKNVKGSGAGGGLVAGLLAICKPNIVNGVDYIIKLTNFKNKIKRINLVITGEGQTDDQTLHGKTAYGIMKASAPKPCIIVSGSFVGNYQKFKAAGFTAIYQSKNINWSLQKNIANAKSNLFRASQKIARSFLNHEFKEITL